MQILVNGLISGLILAVLALGFTAVYLPLKIFYLALGAVYTIVPFLVWGMMQVGWPWYLASVVAIGVGIGISLSCEWLNNSRLERQGASSGAHLISSLGIYIVVVQTVAMTWGNETKVLRAGLDGVLQLGGVTGAIVSVVVLGGFLLWLHYSQLGLQFRAVADNAREFTLRDYNVDQLRLLAFGLAGGMAGVSSLLVAYDIGFDPNGGADGGVVGGGGGDYWRAAVFLEADLWRDFVGGGAIGGGVVFVGAVAGCGDFCDFGAVFVSRPQVTEIMAADKE